MDELVGMKNDNFEDVIYKKYILPDRAGFADRMAASLKLQAELNDDRIVRKLGYGNLIAIKNTDRIIRQLAGSRRLR